ncbi:MAG: hypothetical protein A3C43_05460 [Candidatus Schekmanbacteria bacterium RIFCSPHIGHO2_02_FULL_38_11]|uniref:TNase-like domain-containing protein n=1 Tax=Candidatus Schekmanbacteria bacterium RIFCSPLOWO2_12_FULL_38_15 TaxID=1817883 RepID=A0A1F7SM80_9BACT|nr:MAG: hypothetical protein A3H37_10965 [Candidatus Schekmanbacteria bacterium RIFCSPLOWO2_02_FULL_38_14]OGL53838.1 MAG: hypothetical protein A3C43_05460 [Candidatus Schekmanbacteria bacterium RIFCSPHIGHO2_02_FULL_38_11]OGL54882.1 MAG: hypothetical protein A3G31_02045 [Candidatus Schekmanbacteria bacterium RIFCSPLOWO2_12_FULL_38_15]
MKKKALLTILFLLFYPFISQAFSPASSQESYVVEKVIDGDTIVLNNGEHIRLIGVDTPELHHPRKPVQYFAKEAREFIVKECLGKKVRIGFDWQRKDKYDRTLCYVYLPDGTCLNKEIIRNGYGHAYTRFPFRELNSYRTIESDARKNGKGLWSSKGDRTDSEIKIAKPKSIHRSFSKEYVKGYYKKYGTYVRGYYRKTR